MKQSQQCYAITIWQILAKLFLLFYIYLSAKFVQILFELLCRIFYRFDRHISRSKTANLFAVYFFLV